MAVDGPHVSIYAIAPGQGEATRPGIFVAARTLIKQFQGRRVRPFKMPMLPAAAMHAMVLANDSSASARDMEAAVRDDPGLSARVLRVANSPLYGSQTPVTTIRNAVLRLGHQTLRDVIYQAVAEAHIFRDGAEKELALQRLHSISVAHITRAICRVLGTDGEYAFLCGLLHDIGRPVLSQVLSEESQGLTPEEIRKVIDVAHVDVGAAVARLWKLPALAVEAIERHHDYPEGGDNLYSRIGHVVGAAERLAYHFGLGDHQRTVSPTDEVFATLGLGPSQVELLLHEVATISESVPRV